MGEMEDLRAAQEIVRAMIEGVRTRVKGRVAAALAIIARPGYPETATDGEQALIREAAADIRHLHLLERDITSVERSALLKRVGDDERRVLEAAYRKRTKGKETKAQRAMARWAKVTAGLTR